MVKSTCIAHCTWMDMDTPPRSMYIILQGKVFCCDTHVNISSATATMGCQFLWSAGQESTSWGNMSSLLLRCICSISRSQVVIISSSARPDIAVLNTMKMIYFELIQCFFSIKNPLELSSNSNSSCSRWVDYVYEHDFVAELWMQVADQTSRLESVRNPYTVQIECTMNTFLCQ